MVSIRFHSKFFLLIIIFCFFSIATASEKLTKIENIYKKRLLGDQAFNSGLYDVAMNYYKQYLENAGADTSEERDSYYCLIATCLKASNIKEAEVFYNKVAESNKDFFTNNPLEEEKLKYWNTEILLAKGLNEKAEKSFTEIAKNTLQKDKDTYISALIGKGTAQIRLKKWNEAELTFQTIADSAETPSIKITAIEQLIIIKLVTGNTDSAEKLINELPESNNKISNIPELLKIYSLIKTGKINDAENNYKKLSSELTEKDNTLIYLILSTFADYYIKVKEYDKALNTLQLAFAKAPNLFEKESIAISTLNVLIEANRYNEVIPSAEMFLNFFPDSILKDKILLLYIDILIKLKTEPGKILASIDKYYKLKENPANIQIEIALKIGKMLYEIKKYQNSINYFNYCYKNGTTKNQCGEGLYWSAKSYIMLNDNNQALEELLKIDSKIPEWEDKAILEISLIYLKKRDYIKAKKQLYQLIKKYPDNNLIPPPRFLYAIALSGNNELKQAADEYISFAKYNKQNELAPNAYSRAGDLCLRLTDFTRAAKCYQQILDNYPKSEIIPEVLYKLLYSHYLSGGYSNAIEVVNNLNEKYPQNNYALQASFWLVDYYIENKKYKEALNQLDIILKRNEENKESVNKVLFEKADIFSKMDNNEEALICLDDLISKSNDDNLIAKAYFLKGDIYSKEDKFDEAIENYKNILNYKSQNNLSIAAQGRIGDCYFAVLNFSDNRNETIDLAIKTYNELLSNPNLSNFITIQTKYKLGKCYELLDNKNRAIFYYHEALYENVLDIEEGAAADKEWIGKAGIALAQLFLEDNTKDSAHAAINVYQTLIKNKIQPEDSFKKSIINIKNKFKIKE